MSELKYCPFCGSTEIECHSIHSRFCHGCGVTCIWYGNLRDIDTEAAWNRRAEPMPVQVPPGYALVPTNHIKTLLSVHTTADGKMAVIRNGAFLNRIFDDMQAYINAWQALHQAMLKAAQEERK